MTALDFIAQGVVFLYVGGRLVAHGPPGREDLIEQLRTEVARRVGPMSGDHLPPVPASCPRAGQCGTCGDAMVHYRGGMCELCCLARAKALVGLGRIPAAPRLGAPAHVPAPVRRPLRAPSLEDL